VEAAVLGTPAVSYQPVVSKEFDFELPDAVSRQAFSLDELCDTVRAVVDGKLGPLDSERSREVLERHIAALEGPLAAERMVRVLEEGGYRTGRPPAAPAGDFVRAWLHNHLRTAVKHVNMRRPGHRNNLAYHAHRFPDISVSEIQGKIARMGRLLNRFDGIRVTRMSRYLFRITA